MFDLAEQKQLRPYQEKAIHLVRTSFSRGFRRIVVQSPTGSGKTLTAAKIIMGAVEKGNRVIFTAPAVALIDQTVAAFEAEGIYDIGVMQSKHPRTNPDAAVQVCSVQTLVKRLIPEAAIVIVDEVHIRADVIDTMMDTRPDCFFIGLSATPWRKGMGLRWDNLVIPVTITELIDEGYLSKFTVYAPSIPDLSGVRTKAGEFDESDLEEIMSEGKLVADVVQTWLEKGENRPTLAFAVNCAHAAVLQQQFAARGVSAAYCDAYTDKTEMQLIERSFRNREVSVVCSVRKISIGVDWPVGCIIDAAPTKSEMMHVQKIGRGLRVNPGTEDLVIFDHASNSIRLGLVTDIGYETLDKTEKGEKQVKPRAAKLPKPCSSCGILFCGMVCPACGHKRVPIAGVETDDGELIEITGKRALPTRAEKQQFWSMLLFYCDGRGYKRGWASHKYREKFTVWPVRLSDNPIQPDIPFSNWILSKQIAYAKKMEK